MAFIAVQGLTKRFGPTLAVDRLSFDVEPGMVTGFLGPNGSGKTTTLRCLLGLVRPTAGSTTIMGARYADLPAPARQVGAVLDSAGFHPGRSARAHLSILARQAGLGGPKRTAARVAELLDLVELGEAADRRVKGFSLGMRQRLSLAGALLGDPEVLVLDEPANGLDPEGIRWLRMLLRRLAAEGRTVLVSSHVLAEVAQTVDEVVVIGRGRLLAQGTLPELIGSAATVRVRTPQRRTLADRLAAAGVRAEEQGDDELVVSGSSPEQVGALAAVAGVVVYEIAAAPVTLEDVFLRLTGSPDLGEPAPEPGGGWPAPAAPATTRSPQMDEGAKR